MKKIQTRDIDSDITLHKMRLKYKVNFLDLVTSFLKGMLEIQEGEVSN